MGHVKREVDFMQQVMQRSRGRRESSHIMFMLWRGSLKQV
ncbi:hypothetical protein Ahy_A05g021801 isoform B [Arachis hypogaea]|uniref:Uncharacterized protein n=1 Tax=Arachis hypogaea TaxID=3818 RepID=A0A445CYJ6_ARAHY|nr:hypothetical protein Ahy_A05g021801 isoform B [Arachis hypogaea]